MLQIVRIKMDVKLFIIDMLLIYVFVHVPCIFPEYKDLLILNGYKFHKDNRF